jgi:glycosyltransferase involved in cell wall biosynthesis
MRILYVCSDFGIPVYGHKGASIHLRSVARALSDLGHDVRILSPSTERQANRDFAVPVVSLPANPLHVEMARSLRKADKWLQTMPSGHQARISQETRNLLYNSTVASAREVLGGWEPDVVYERYSLFAYGGMELARSFGVPHLLEVNAPLVVEQQRARGLHLHDVALEIEQRIWRGTDAFLGVSQELTDLARSVGVAADHLHVVPNGIDPRPYADAARARGHWRQQLQLGEGPVIGFVGSLKSWHGTDVLLQAFAAMARQQPTCSLLYVGNGPMRETLQSLAADRGLTERVRFTGAVDHARVPELLAAMDIAVAPYLPTEDFYFSPIKVYEYLAAQLPVIASDIGQISAMIHNGQVLPCVAGDVGSLRRALEGVLANPQAARACAQRGTASVLAERTWAANAERIVQLASSLATARI